MTEKLNRIRKDVYSAHPLVHCITNPISITRCADIILSAGASPMMAAHPGEVEEITVTASALLLNTGNITDERMRSMEISAGTAKKENIPFVLDCVGASCSRIRREYILSLVGKYTPSVIKGNASEITALSNGEYRSIGVDSESLEISRVTEYAVGLAIKYGCTVQVSGKSDIITDGNSVLYVHNGCEMLSRITGTGCMLGALTACYLTRSTPAEAALCACGVMGVCGELSQNQRGTGSFFVSLMDNISTLTDGDFEELLKTEDVKK